MADKRTTPETSESSPQDAGPGVRRKKREGPTIDLTATEVPQAAEPESAPQSDPPSPAPATPQAAAEPPSASVESPPPDAPASRRGSHINIGTYIAGVAGALAMTLILGALWLTGLLPVRPVAAPSAPAALDTKAIAALNERLSKIEETIAKLPAGDAGLAGRLAAAEDAVKSLGSALTVLNRRNDAVAVNAAQAMEHADAATKAVAELRASVQDMAKDRTAGPSVAELDALQKRIAGLEQSTQAARNDIAKTATADSAARLALSAMALRDAATSGAPFAAELAQAKSLGASDKDLAPLAPFAATGIPSAQSLAQELRALLPAIRKVSGTQTQSGGFLERLEANAGKLVRIRPVDAPPGDDASSVLVRLEIEATKADIPAAIADLDKLSDSVRAPAQDWIERAKARQAALAASRHFATGTARALGPIPGPKADTP